MGALFISHASDDQAIALEVCARLEAQGFLDRIEPHTHPDSREVTIISGVFATAYGEKFDADKLKILPAGSFYTEPANVPHYIEIKEETVLQVSGTGPSGRKFIE